VIDLRLIAVLLGILGILVHFGKPRETGSVRLWPALSDLALVALFVVIVVSQYSVGRLSPLGPAELARKWVFPYLAGRLFIGSNRDLKRVAPLMSAAIMIVCGMAIVEALTQINLPNKILGRRYGVLEAGEGYRWGMKRAQGSMDHPIFFGMALVMSMPWALHGMEIAKKTNTRKWMKFAPWALAVGLFATVSRGPQFCSLVPVGTYFFFRKPGLRVPIVLGAQLGGLFHYTVRDQVLGVLGKMAGEKEEMVSTIEIGGEPYEYTGTRHRILLWIAYQEAIEKLPKFFYGLELRGVPLDEHLAMRFGSIDGHYLMFLLQHGYFAIGLFLLLGLLGMLNSAYVALNRKQPSATLAAGLFGAILAVLGNLSSVWFPPDFGSVWLFCVGLAATLARLPDPPDIDSPAPAPVHVPVEVNFPTPLPQAPIARTPVRHHPNHRTRPIPPDRKPSRNPLMSEQTARPDSASCGKLLVISPVKDEAAFLPTTIASLVAQTKRPDLWVIVDDGSSDDTGKIAEAAAAEHDWIRVLRRQAGTQRRVGPGVIEAFYAGLDSVPDWKSYDFICKTDGDLEFQPRYFEILLDRFARSPRLGSASGKVFTPNEKGVFEEERIGPGFSFGCAKLYRRTCFEEIGGFVRQVMWDGIDCHRSRMLNWDVVSYDDPELAIKHFRRMGSSFQRIYHGRRGWGRGQYSWARIRFISWAYSAIACSKSPVFWAGSTF